MKNKFIMFRTACLIPLLVLMSSCSPDENPVLFDIETPVSEPEHPDDNWAENDNNDEMAVRSLTVTIGNTSFVATLEENETTRAFTALLPMTVDMSELNGNEKYCYLSQSLPVDSYYPGIIQEGDLMLYGSNCVVLFYETFSSGYSYTRIGRIDNPDELAESVGKGNITVTFEMMKK